MGELVVLVVEPAADAEERFALLLEWRRVGEALSAAELRAALEGWRAERPTRAGADVVDYSRALR